MFRYSAEMIEFLQANKRMSGMFFDFKRCGNLVP